MTYADLEAEVRREFPGFRTARKSDSRIMAVAGAALRVATMGRMSSFMSSYVTTVRDVMYVPSRWDSYGDVRKALILRHERVHMRQSRRHGFLLFTFLYIFFPLPVFLAISRARFEMEAYEETMRAVFEGGGITALYNLKFRMSVIRQFTGPAFLWMMPFNGAVTRWYDRTAERLCVESVSRRT